MFKAESSSGQIITTFAGNGSLGDIGDNGAALDAMLTYPNSICTDLKGNVFVLSANKVRKIDAAGIITTIAGNGVYPNRGDGGAAIDAFITSPTALDIDAMGNLYLLEGGLHSLRKISAVTGIITTVAGDGNWGRSGDGGLAVNARLNSPAGIDLDVAGNVYIADMLNHCIRKVDVVTGIISTIAGNGLSTRSAGDGGLATNAMIPYPLDVCVDRNNNLYITEHFNGITSRVRKVDFISGIISAIAGNGNTSSGGDGGPATNASFDIPRALTLDRDENIYIAEYAGSKVRKIDIKTGIISTIAGNGTRSFSGDGGPGKNAGLHFAFDVSFDNSGYLYIADRNNHRVRRVGLNIPVCKPLVTINASLNNICAGLLVTFTALASNGGTNPYFVWKKNGTIVGTNSSTYASNILINGDVITCELTSNDVCAQPKKVNSNVITMSVQQESKPEVITTASADTICEGTNITFTAFNKNGNPNPSYQWTVDGKDAGTDDPVYNVSTLTNGSLVQCRMTVSQCTGNSIVYSAPIAMVVHQKSNPSIEITASSIEICSHSPVTFTAIVKEAGVNERLAWKVNGIFAGAVAHIYSSSTLNNGDIVSCELIVDTTLKCAVNSKLVSNSILIKVVEPFKVLVRINASDNNFCGTKPIVFLASTQSPVVAASYQWHLNGNMVSKDSLRYTINTPADGDVVKLITTFYDTGCHVITSDTSNIITVSIRPFPVVSITPKDTSAAFGSVVQLNAAITGGVASVAWSPANALTSQAISPVTTPIHASTTYTLNVVGTNGCMARKDAIVRLMIGLNMPNSFTPNGDGKNDVFRIPPGVTIQLKDLSVYDRWGRKIFSTNDKGKGWDGRCNNLPSGPGTYVYSISATDYHNQPITAKGTLILIR